MPEKWDDGPKFLKPSIFIYGYSTENGLKYQFWKKK